MDGAEQMSAVVDAIGKEDGQGMSLTVIAKSVSGAPPVAFFIGAYFITIAERAERLAANLLADRTISFPAFKAHD